MPARLLVLPLTRHERGHLDLVHEGDRVKGVRHLRDVVGIGVDLRQEIGGLSVEDLVLLAGRIALLDPLVGPALTAVGTGRKGFVLALFRPGDREAGVEDAAGIERRRGRVDRRQR